jgi:hypothetical protein
MFFITITTTRLVISSYYAAFSGLVDLLFVTHPVGAGYNPIALSGHIKIPSSIANKNRQLHLFHSEYMIIHWF